MRDTAAVLGVFLVLGLVCAGCWALLVDPPTYTRTPDGGSMSDDQLRRRFDVDAWYAVLALVAGTSAGGVLTWWRSRNPLLTTVLVALGSAVAAAEMAAIGGILGPQDTSAALAAAEVGDNVPIELSVTAAVTYLTWPIGSLLGALAVLWSATGDVAAPESAGAP